MRDWLAYLLYELTYWVSMALMTFHQGQLFVELWRRPADEVKRVAQAEVVSMAEAEAQQMPGHGRPLLK